MPVELASVWADGAEGGVALAETVVKTIADLATFVSGYPAGTNKFIQSGFNSTVAQAKIDRKKEEAHAFATNLGEGQHDYENSAANNSATITSRLLCSLHQGVTTKTRPSCA